MKPDFQKAHIAGVERVAAWSDVLDSINVFPVADGDTGRNLIASLTPLRYLDENRDATIQQLLLAARGNSGNIAARFFAGFLTADTLEDLLQAAKLGRDQAWQAVSNPVHGTMLTVFDTLVDVLAKNGRPALDASVDEIIDQLEAAVKLTPQLLPGLKPAGVVDSGALGMYLFFESFFKHLAGRTDGFQPLAARFKGLLAISSSFQAQMEAGHCVDTVIRLDGNEQEKIDRLRQNGDNVVLIPHKDYLKVHLHTADVASLRRKMEDLGQVVQWTDDDLAAQINAFKQSSPQGALHIMTDAAGSMSREMARQLGVTLLDSYIIAGDKSLPESLFTATELYQNMRAGIQASTSQASMFERHQYYQRVTELYPRVLYLCVGSVYTGNFDVAMQWKNHNDAGSRLIVIDTGAASGRLGTIALATARYAQTTDDPEAVIDFARRAVRTCEEYVFLDKLKYLAAGGRLSKSSAFFGDMLHVKPIISPTAEGAKKMGTAKNAAAQLKFALEKLNSACPFGSAPLIMLEYSDNRDWVETTAQKAIAARFESSEILLQPISLTSGVHFGPGTWAVAFLPAAVHGS